MFTCIVCAIFACSNVAFAQTDQSDNGVISPMDTDADLPSDTEFSSDRSAEAHDTDTNADTDTATENDTASDSTAFSNADTALDSAPDTVPDSAGESLETNHVDNTAPIEPIQTDNDIAMGAVNDVSGDAMLDMGLEALLNTPVEVWTATKTKTTLQEAPAIITVVTREDIQRYGYQSLAEVLNHVSGFYVIDDHIIPNLGIRGIAGSMHNESSNVKVLIDGVNMAFRSTGGNWLGPELVPFSIVKRIEIIRGPASALYGADAFLGVINIITNNGEDISGANSIASASYDSFENGGVNFDFAGGGSKDGFELIIAGRLNREVRDGLVLPASSPAPKLAYYNDDVESDGMTQKSDNLYARIGYKFNDHFQLRLFATGSRIVRGGEFSSWGHLSNGVDNQGRERGTRIGLQKGVTALQLSITPNDDLKIDYNVSYQAGKPSKDDRIDIGSDLYYVKRDLGYNVLESNVELSWQLHDDFTGIAAGEFTADWENLPSSLRVARSSVGDISAGNIMEASSTRQGTDMMYNIGALTQGIWTGLSPYLSLTGGFRFDNHSLYGNQFSGRAGVISNPVKILHIKFLYGSAFKAPSSLLLHGVPHDVGDIIGNPDLKPQKVHTLETQFTLKPSKYFSFSTGAAYSHLKDKAEFVQRGINRVADNISEMNSFSWESEASFMYDEWIRVDTGFEYQWTWRASRVNESVYMGYLLDDKNEIYPQYIARGNIYGVIPNVPLQLSTGIVYVGPRPSSAMNALENLESYNLPAYAMLCATISTVAFQFLEDKDTVLSIVGRNLLNRQVADPGFAGIDYPIRPLTVYVQVLQHF